MASPRNAAEKPQTEKLYFSIRPKLPKFVSKKAPLGGCKPPTYDVVLLYCALFARMAKMIKTIIFAHFAIVSP